MTDKEFFILLALALALTQFLYRIWDKKDSKLVLENTNANTDKLLDQIKDGNSNTLHAIEKTLETLSPHLERSRQVHGIVRDLKGMHEIRDDDGRFMWYTPRELIENVRELTQLSHTVATTQKHITKILERQTILMEKSHKDLEITLYEHQKACTNQYHILKDDMKMKEER